MKQRILFSMLVLAISGPAWADSDAITFGIQAGAIAGAAQACGQDPAVLNSRSGEAIMLLATDNNDRDQALAAYQRALQESYQSEMASQKVACTQVLQDYNSLPILKADYKQSVLAQLIGGQTNNQTATPVNNMANTPTNNSVTTQQAAVPSSQQAVAANPNKPQLPSQMQQIPAPGPAQPLANLPQDTTPAVPMIGSQPLSLAQPNNAPALPNLTPGQAAAPAASSLPANAALSVAPQNMVMGNTAATTASTNNNQPMIAGAEQQTATPPQQTVVTPAY